MTPKRRLTLVLLSALIGLVVQGDETARNGGGDRQVVELLGQSLLFDTTQPPVSVLNTNAPQAEFAAPADRASSFTVRLTVDLKPFDRQKAILDIPNVLSVRLRQHDARNRQRQNNRAFKMPDGSVPVLEATVALHSLEHPDWNEMTIGIPLAMLAKPAAEHAVVLNFSGVAWTMYVDGELLDNDFPFGYGRVASRTWLGWHSGHPGAHSIPQRQDRLKVDEGDHASNRPSAHTGYQDRWHEHLPRGRR